MQFRTNKCTHNEKGRCINCLTHQLKAEKKQKETSEGNGKLKCIHPPNMKCLQCMQPVKGQNGSENSLCKHPAYEHCSNCLMNKKQYYDTFQQYLERLANDCKHKKPCRKCVPPLSRKTFLVDKECRNHIPYPQGQCDACMAPTVSIHKQPYTHVKKVIVRTTAIHQITQTKLYGVLLGTVQGDTIYVDNIYFPRQQSKVSHHINPELLNRYQQIFSLLGYSQVGIIYSSSLLTSMDLMLSSVFQEYFCTINKSGYQISQFITMRLNNDEINPYFECFMISDQFQALNRHGLVFETKAESSSFDMITAKSDKNSNAPSLPTFIRKGIETQEILFEEIIVWIETEFQENFFIENRNIYYPFFTIEKQTIENMQMFVAVEMMDPVEKYRNIQFLLHMYKLFGRDDVILFLTTFIYEDPEYFLKEKMKAYQRNNNRQQFPNQNSLMLDQSFYG